MKKVIDLRSDTVTRPVKEMYNAIMDAKLGDDVYKDDETTNELEAMAANMFGKEAALFVPSGTFGNQISVFTHIQKGQEVILGEDCHIVVHEQGAVGAISGGNIRPLKTIDGMMSTEDILKVIREDDIHYPKTGLICLENAYSNGKVVPIEYMEKVYSIAKERNIPLHLDGARIFNAATYLNVDVKEIAKFADSIQICLSKGLCSPIGSLVLGDKEFINKVKRNRKLLGGGMRQTGILAACGIVSLNKMTKRIIDDHNLAKEFEIMLMDIPQIKVREDLRDINMIFFSFNVNEEKFLKYMKNSNIRINGSEGGLFRFVVLNDIDYEMIKYTSEIIKKYIRDECIV